MSYLLEIENLEKTYSKLSGRVLHGISFKVKKGEVVAIIGPSGSGKTTLLNILGGLDTSYKGSVKVDGKELRSWNLVTYRRKAVAMIFQHFYLMEYLNVLENVMMPLVLEGYSMFEAKYKAMRMLEEVGLAKHWKKRPNQLSGGQMQRVAVARALVKNPLLILADEPTGNLDTKNGKKVVDLIVNLSREHGVTALVVTHDLEVISSIQKRIFLRDGKILKTEGI